MKKKFDKALYIIWLICLISLFGIQSFKHGLFGTYCIEQGTYKGDPWTWVWHNWQIVWGHHTQLSEFNETTFPNDRKEAEKRIWQIKNVERHLK